MRGRPRERRPWVKLRDDSGLIEEAAGVPSGLALRGLNLDRERLRLLKASGVCTLCFSMSCGSGGSLAGFDHGYVLERNGINGLEEVTRLSPVHPRWLPGTFPKVGIGRPWEKVESMARSSFLRMLLSRYLTLR